MKKIVENERLIYKCCKLYYENMMTQQRIAQQLGVSRVSVSRMLQAGREMEMVKVQVISPDALTYTHLAQDLEQLFGLKEVIVVENDPLGTQYDDQNAMSAATLNLLENCLHENDVVGVSMGLTLHHICLGKREKTEPIPCIFVPTVGGIQNTRSRNNHIHANRVAADFAHMFGAQYIEFFAPAIFSNREVLESFSHEAPMQEILYYYERMKTILFGVGVPRRFSSTVTKAGYMTTEELNYMVELGAVGDLSLQFFDKNGETQQFREFNERVTGLSLQQIKRIENKICIAGGKTKARAILGAIRGGYISMLVTDQECAEMLVAMGKENES